MPQLIETFDDFLQVRAAYERESLRYSIKHLKGLCPSWESVDAIASELRVRTKHISAAALARATEVSRRTVTRFRSGEMPSLGLALRLAGVIYRNGHDMRLRVSPSRDDVPAQTRALTGVRGAESLGNMAPKTAPMAKAADLELLPPADLEPLPPMPKAADLELLPPIPELPEAMEAELPALPSRRKGTESRRKEAKSAEEFEAAFIDVFSQDVLAPVLDELGKAVVAQVWKTFGDRFAMIERQIATIQRQITELRGGGDRQVEVVARLATLEEKVRPLDAAIRHMATQYIRTYDPSGFFAKMQGDG